MKHFKIKPSLYLLLLVLIIYSTRTFAQFSINSELRNRFEVRDGYRALSAEDATPSVLIWQRSRISFNYETENLRLKFTPQDVRLWGDESQRSSTGVFGDDASFELFEGYAELKLGSSGWISVGRQAFKYDNQRILAARNWNNNGLTYDAVLFKLKFNDWDIHLGTTWNTLSESSSDNLYPSNRIKNLDFLWMHRKFGDNLSLSLLQLASGVTETDTTNTIHYKHTSGVYSTYKNNGLNIWGEAYYQYGKTNQDKDVSAYLFAMDASYSTRTITPGIGITYLSGNSKSGSDQIQENLFDILYGARHRFYGLMDYYRNFSSNTSNGGLTDINFYLDYKISKSLNICNTGHFFQLAQTNSSTPVNKNLGYENDLTLKYKFNGWGILEAGYVLYQPTNSLELIQGVNDAGLQQFVYVQLTLTPILFKQEKQENL